MYWNMRACVCVCVCVSIQLLLFCYFTFEYLIGLTFFINTSQFTGDFHNMQCCFW